MTPDEVCEALASIGASVSRRTLLHYEEAGLIPKPERGGGGKKGRFTNYPEWTVEEAFTAWSFIHGRYATGFFGVQTPKISPVAIKAFRDDYYLKVEMDEEIVKIAQSEEYRQMLVDEHELDQERRKNEEEEKSLAEYREQHSDDGSDYQIWYELDTEARYRVNSGFRLLWEAKRFKARIILNKKALVK